MRTNQRRSLWLGVSILGVLTLSPGVLGQTSPAPAASIPVPTDWSHRHVIFSRPATPEQAALVEQDPRYWQQQYRNQPPVTQRSVAGGEGVASEAQSPASIRRHGARAGTEGAWQETMGSGASVGASNFPAKFSFLGTTANCGNATQPDFVTYNTGLTGSATQATVVAYDNLYSGCMGTVPSTYWAYNTNGQILTSVTYSESGTQVAFVETNTGLEGNLVLLKWAASTTETAGSPKTLTAVSAAQYQSCPTPPCMTEFLLTNSSGTPADDRTSSVFIDYAGDIAYVGDSHGWLHKFTPVFKGVPAEVRTGWPVELNPANPNAVSDPVYDSVSKNIFVGDAGGYLYRVNPTTGGVTKSGQLDFGVGIEQGPIVDSASGFVYVFSSSDGTKNCTGGAACSAVYQLTTRFAAGNTGTNATVGDSVVFGSATNPNPLYFGAFDNSYITSGTATGNLYVCGNTGANPTLYRVPITGGVFGPAVAVAPLTPDTKTPACSSVTDVFNANATGGAFERLFFSVQDNAHPTLCANKGCAMSFMDLPWQPNTAYSVGQEVLVLRTANDETYINTVIVAGNSGANPPTWPGPAGSVTVNGTATFLDQGLTVVTPLANWKPNTAYALHGRIVDGNGNVEIVSAAGTSGPGPAPPTWSTTAGGTTLDGTVLWINAGVLPSAALPAEDGTSGIIIDNTVNSGTLSTSQVYFSTLGNQVCTTSGTNGGCAVQASQSALK